MVDETEREIPSTWETFLPKHAEVIFRVVRLFADSYDERMDLFLFVCDRLRENDMRRLRAFRFRPEAPCRFSTYLAVVVRNLSLDFLRARDGRYRPFQAIAGLDSADQHLFEYHLHDGRPLEESRGLLRDRHGIRLSSQEAAERAGRLSARLSASQRWRILSRLYERRDAVPLDAAVDGASGEPSRAAGPPIADDRADPEAWLQSAEAGQVFREALGAIPARQRLALVLRYRDGLAAREVAGTLGVQAPEAERLLKEGLRILRERLRRSRVGRTELESSELPALWSGTPEGAP